MRISRLAVAAAAAAVIATPLAVANAVGEGSEEVTGDIVVRTFWNTGEVDEGGPLLKEVLKPLSRSCTISGEGLEEPITQQTNPRRGFTTFRDLPIGAEQSYTVTCEKTDLDAPSDATDEDTTGESGPRTIYFSGDTNVIDSSPVDTSSQDGKGFPGTDYGDFRIRALSDAELAQDPPPLDKRQNNAFLRFSWTPRGEAKFGDVPFGGDETFISDGATTTVVFPAEQPPLPEGVPPCQVSTEGEAVPVTVVNGDVVQSDNLAGYARLADIELPPVDDIGACLFEITIKDDAPLGINRIKADLDGTGSTFLGYTELEFCSLIGGGPTAGSTMEGSPNEQLWCLDRVKYTGREVDAATRIDLTIRGYNDPRTAW